MSRRGAAQWEEKLEVRPAGLLSTFASRGVDLLGLGPACGVSPATAESAGAAEARRSVTAPAGPGREAPIPSSPKDRQSRVLQEVRRRARVPEMTGTQAVEA
ncbi:hypothetical protein NDU88_006544 [Pleurodeles waltl]|uniref:Uncharacterized protein n=1 Tax=Pleurodeles waltl TaxID=8319 RepID=A0AAV7QLJ5_PLEWA|nr:hypothetical protein NDU88_006544 [Pleurodeles waltl]